jgi:ribonuclease P protein component
MASSWIKGRFLWVRPGKEDAGVILVIRKALGNAVKRNRLKRQLRHICYPLDLPLGSIVILAQVSATKTPFHFLQEELKELVAKLV